MKKIMAAVAAGVMMLGTASFASAASTITVGGSIEENYRIQGNTDLGGSYFGATKTTINPAHHDSASAFSTRILLNVDAKIADGLSAFVELDTPTSEMNWGGAPALNHQAGTMNIKQAWINFMVPGAPVGIKIGHQPLALGHGIFLDTSRMGSDAILAYSKPLPELLVAGVYIKGVEQGLTTATPILAKNNDADFYAMLANYTFMPGNTVGVNVTYVNDRKLLGPVGLVTGWANDVTAYNIGLIADGAVSGINYKAEFDYIHENAENAMGSNKDWTLDAWAAMLGVSAKVAMVNVALEGAYGTGNQDNDPSVANSAVGFRGGNIGTKGGVAAPVPGLPGAGSATGRTDHAYTTPYGATSYNYAFIYNDKVGQGPQGSGGGFGFGDGFGGFGLANTGYVKLSVSGAPMDKLTAGLDVLYLRASENAVANIKMNTGATTWARTTSKDLGWEIDANADYKVYDNLTLSLRGGVFMPGAWYEYSDQPLIPAASRVKQQTENAYAFESKLKVNF